VKTRISILVSIFVLLVTVGMAQSKKEAPDGGAAQQVARANAPQSVPNAQPLRGQTGSNANHSAKRVISGDDAYKENCTRCHSEVPQRNSRSINTTVRHMRVRANISMDEAKAILEYLTQ